MTKIFLLISLITLSLCPSLMAQNANTDPRESVSFGVKAGLNYANVWDEQGQDFSADAKAGFAGGVFLGIPIGRYVGIQPEILVSQKGYKGKGSILGQPYTFSRTTTHLDIPIQLQIKPADFVTLVAGPQYSFLMHAKDITTSGGNSTSNSQDFNNDNIRRNTLGFVVGADFNISQLIISGRAGWDFQNNNGDGSSSEPRYKNQWLQLTLGYKI